MTRVFCKGFDPIAPSDRISRDRFFSAAHTGVRSALLYFRIAKEAVRIFLRGYPLLFTAVSAAVRETAAGPVCEICRRFVGGYAGGSALVGTRGRSVHYMHTVQSRINTGYFASR
jgi:hypothetical protein